MAAFETTRVQPAFAGRLGAAIVSTIAAIADWNEARKTRKILSQLTDRELADIGLDRRAITEIQ